MKFDEKLHKISEKAQSKRDKIGIILGISLLVACGLSYFVLDAFGEQEFLIDCPKNAYHGLDNQGNTACRDVLTNQILEPESVRTVDSGLIVDSGSVTMADSSSEAKSNSEINVFQETEMTLSVEPIPIFEIIIFFLIGILASILVISAKKGKFQIFQRRSWSSIQKKQVRDRQYGNCNMCFTPPTQWKYNCIDGNKNNNELNNCQGLCPDCLAVKIKRDNQRIYQESN